MVKVVRYPDPLLIKLSQESWTVGEQVESQVKEILAAVKVGGDQALLDFTRRFDGAELSPATLKVSPEEIREAYGQVDEAFLQGLRQARDNIRAFHRRQLPYSWLEPDEKGTLLGMLQKPLARVGIYVPGGTAPLPSSVLMNAVPAQVAGVREIVMVTPPRRDGTLNPHTLVAAAEAGVTEIYKVGGAQAVAALAYGTQTIRRVDKITGPGNIYVTAAKKLVFGVVGIDMLAGPSEILVLADSTANPVHVAADLLSQAEHDVLAGPYLVTPDEALAAAVQKELESQLAVLPRKEIAAQSLKNRGLIVIVPDMAAGVEVANLLAPEHLELLVANPLDYLGQINNAGAIFLGPYSPEPVGDYYAGPNHVLPTAGTARFFSPLNVETFMKKTSVIGYSARSFRAGARAIMGLAEVEGLHAHANAVRVRLEGDHDDL